jgi:hypothetical protein
MYYVSSAASSPAGSDSNAGTILAPFLTVDHAINHSAFVCGDVLNVTADGHYVNGDFNIPNYPNCGLLTAIQSSAISLFTAPGWRTNPTTDAANYGKLTLTSGIFTGPETHGVYGPCQIASVTGVTITFGFCSSGMSTYLSNGQQIYLEINNSGNLNVTTMPSGLALMTHYYVKNCSTSPACGATGSTLELSATSGGSSITPGACTGSCSYSAGAIQLSVSIQVTAGSSILTSPDSFVALGGTTPVALSEAGLQQFGTLPTGFARDTLYYPVSISGRNFGLSATPGGAAIVPSDTGSGPLIMATTQLAHNWLFDGLEFYSATSATTAQLTLGSGSETSVIGMARNIEVRRSYLHGDSSACPSSGPKRGIAENGIAMSIHDNWFSSFCTGEGQAIVAYGSAGPTLIQNNFMEAAAEITMSGGLGNSSGIANQYRTFIGNYYYKPPSWKIANLAYSGAPSGPCWYDATDPANVGGEWYRDSVGAQTYQCGTDFLWHATGATIPGIRTVKNMAEHKDMRYALYSGNLFNYSWVSAQSGQCLAFHQGEDSGPGRANDHITAMNNICRHAYQFSTEQSHCNGTTIYCAVLPTQHVVTNNLAILDGNGCGDPPFIGSTCGYTMHDSNMDGHPASAIYRAHNTVVMPDGSNAYPQFQSSAFIGSVDSGTTCVVNFGFIDRAVYKNNITATDWQATGVNGGGTFCYFTNAFYSNNAIVNHNSGISYSSIAGTGNTFTNFDTSAANNAAVQYVSPSTGDYHLAPGSPYSAATTSPALLSDDGTDLGADIDKINQATSGAAAGTPPWNVMYHMQVTCGPDRCVFSYTAPTAASCTISGYYALARNLSGSAAFSVIDTGVSGAVIDGLYRQIPITGLTPGGTAYPGGYSVACGGGVIMLGALQTTPTSSVSRPVTVSASTSRTWSLCGDAACSAVLGTATGTQATFLVAHGTTDYVAVTVGGVPVTPATVVIAP